MAAVLAAGPRAVLSHRSAAGLWGIRRWRDGNVDVTITGLQAATARHQVARDQPPGR